MASNLSEITDAIENLNVTFTEIPLEDILPNAIETGNQTTNGWLGLTVFIIFCLAVVIHVLLKKQEFQITNSTSLILISLSIILDLGIQLLQTGILASVQIFTFLFVVFFVISVISFLHKELISQDT